MSIKIGYCLSLIIFAIVACLMLPACRTCTETAHDDTFISAAARETRCKLKEIIIPELALPLHATLADAVGFLKRASHEYDTPWKLLGERGVRFELRLPPAWQPPADPFVGNVPTNLVQTMGTAMSVRSISLQDALQLICEVSRMRWTVEEDGTVVIKEIVWPDREEWVTRSYTVPQELANALFDTHDAQTTDTHASKAWEQFFEQLGVKRPFDRTNDVFQCTCGKTHRDLTEYVYQAAIGTLRVTNTPENMEIIEQVFDVFALRRVEVEMQIHAFRTADIERLRLSDGVSLESLMDLRQNGKTKPVASATAQAKSGQEVIVKAVQEVIYPTELLADVGQPGSNVTARSAAKARISANFTMRETGMILQVTPEVSPFEQSQIHLRLYPQWICLEGWESYPADLSSGWTRHAHSFKQPVFGVTSFETQAAVKDGDTLLLGSSSTPDGEWVHVGFLTARCMDNQTNMPAKKALRQQARRNAEVLKKLKHIVIPEMTFRPPATILDAFRFFREASMKYDKQTIPQAQRGVDFILRFGHGWTSMGSTTNMVPFVAPAHSPDRDIPAVPAMSARYITMYDALKLVCTVSGLKFIIWDGVVWIVPDYGYDEKYMTRIYPVPSSDSFASCLRIRVDAGFCADENQTQDWKPFFEKLGVRLAVGSSFGVKKLSSVNLLCVTSSRQTRDEIEQALEEVVYSRKIEVDVQIHAFPVDEIKKVQLSGDMSVEALMDLRKKGKAKQVASATTLTKAGGEACVKAVREVIYPTELSNTSEEGGGVLMPSTSVMREVGMTLLVFPEITATEQPQIRLKVKPQWVTLEGWKSYPANLATGWSHKTLPLRQPVFGMTSFETETIVKNGDTVLLGSSSTPDGKWVHVGFLTAKECR